MVLVVASVTAFCSMVSSGNAADTYRRHPHHVARTYEYAAPGYPHYSRSADWIAAAAARAQTEPGVTSELSPDAKQTATGGPVGGVPGFDGT